MNKMNKFTINNAETFELTITQYKIKIKIKNTIPPFLLKP